MKTTIIIQKLSVAILLFTTTAICNSAIAQITDGDIQVLENQFNAGMTTLDNMDLLNKTAEQLQKDLESVESIMKENSVLLNKEYQSEEEIDKEYNQKLANLNELAKVHLEIKSKIQSLEYSAAGELMNNSDTAALGVLAGVGALASTEKKESIAYSERARTKLQNSKFDKLFKYRYKDADFQLDLIENKMHEYFSKTYPADYSNFLNHTLVAGYKAGMKYDAFKKLFPKSKIRETGIGSYQMENASSDSDFYFKMDRKGLKFRLMEVSEVKSFSAGFSPEKLKEYQQKILEEIEFFDSLFNLKPQTYKFKLASNAESEFAEGWNSKDLDEQVAQVKALNPNINEAEIRNAIQLYNTKIKMDSASANPVNSSTLVTWTDNANKEFSLFATIKVKDDKITLKIERIDKNLQTPDFD